MGLNLRPGAYPADVAATATDVQSEVGRTVDRGEVFAAMLEHLADALALLEAGAAGDILQRWRTGAPLAVGSGVSWVKDGREIRGVTAGLDDSGALLVRTPDGVERVIAGELRWQFLGPGS